MEQNKKSDNAIKRQREENTKKKKCPDARIMAFDLESGCYLQAIASRFGGVEYWRCFDEGVEGGFTIEPRDITWILHRT